MKKYTLIPTLLFLFIILFTSGCQQEQTTVSSPKEEVLLYDSVRLQRIHRFQENLISEGMTGSNVALVVKGGRTIYHDAVNSGKTGDADITPHTVFPIWSMSKPITVVALMTLFEEDRFLLNDPVGKYIPSMEKLLCKDENGKVYPCKNTLRIKHLLAHRSGWGYNLVTTGGYRLAITDSAQADLAEFMEILSTVPLSHEPGAKYTYGINTAVAGRLVEVLSGKTFYEYLKENIFEPLDMPHTKFFLTEAERKVFQPLYRVVPEGAGYDDGRYDEMGYSENHRVYLGGEGMVSTLEDYSHFCQMLLDEGIYKGRRILSPATVALLHSPQSTQEEYGENGMVMGYSFYSLESPEKFDFLAPKGIFGWSGYHNTHFWIDPANHLYGILMTRRSPYSGEVGNRFRRAVYQAVIPEKK